MSSRTPAKRSLVSLALVALALLPLAPVAEPMRAQPEVSKDTGQVLLVDSSAHPLLHRTPAQDFRPSVAYQWLDILLEASGRDAARHNPRPTVLSRAMAIVLTAMYDAWAAYDAAAVGTRLGGSLRRPPGQRSRAHQEQAIGHAAYRALAFVYPEESAWLSERLRALGGDPHDDSMDPGTPRGVGNIAAAAVIAHRRDDGANQSGARAGPGGRPYSDYTGYRPVNTPARIVDPLRWTPIPFADGKGGSLLPGFLTAHWGRVKPFALASASQFRPPPPPAWGSRALEREIDEVVAANADLTLEQKAIVELMREGPRSTGQSGHWLQFAQDVSRRDRLDLDGDIKLFFAVANVVMDAFIACWEAKRHYDTGRPYWWVRLRHGDRPVWGWAGPGQGVQELGSTRWRPYSPDLFPTPPFPGYPSGHATASGAASRLLELFTGDDRFGAVAVQRAGALTEPDAAPGQMQARSGRAPDGALDPVVHVAFPSFTRAAELAAMSRLWGGYHVRVDNEEGLILGRRIAMFSWPRYQAYFDGTASAATASPQPSHAPTSTSTSTSTAAPRSHPR